MSHALLSASGSCKWINCPPSARAEAELPEEVSPYAEEGRLAHSIAELKVRKFIEPMGPQKFKKALKAFQDSPLYQKEIDECTDTYFDYISRIVHGYKSPPFVAVERKLDFSHVVPEGFGTGDCIIIGGGIIYVIDYKHGKGVEVSAERNTQMMLYGIGAYQLYGFLYPIERVKLVIVQPRISDTPSEWECSIQELVAWGESIKPIAEQAFKGEGAFNPGPWCDKGFCRLRRTCRARCENFTALQDFGGKLPPLLTNHEVGKILKVAENLVSWYEKLNEFALTELLAGREVPGWKAVEGRSNRKIEDIDTAFGVLKANGTDEALLYKRVPAGITELEKLFGKKEFEALLGPYIIKPPGKPTLAPVEDKRPAITNQVSAAQDFQES